MDDATSFYRGEFPDANTAMKITVTMLGECRNLVHETVGGRFLQCYPFEESDMVQGDYFMHIVFYGSLVSSLLFLVFLINHEIYTKWLPRAIWGFLLWLKAFFPACMYTEGAAKQRVEKAGMTIRCRSL